MLDGMTKNLLAAAALAAAMYCSGAAASGTGAVTAQAPDAERGRALFATCAACHQPDGSGVPDGSVPAIAGQYCAVIQKQLLDFRDDQRWNLRMEKVLYQRHLTEPRDFADIAAYACGLPRRATRNVGDGSALAVGTGAYFRACERCHGAVGEGSAARLTPLLGGQHYAYLQRQIRYAGDRRRPNMAAIHEKTVRGLSLDEINGIADYLSRLDPKPGIVTPPDQ